MKKNTAEKYDRNMAVNNNSDEGLRYIPISTEGIRLGGFAFCSAGETLRRLPDDPALPKAVNILAMHTAGGRIDFRSNTTRIWVKVKLQQSCHMDHMPDVGSCGFDLYIGEPGKSFMLGTSRCAGEADEFVSKLNDYALPGTMQNFTINFPLYSGIESLLIGVDQDAEILPPAPWKNNKKMVFYGTSITQGGCASRPGMAYTNILSRRFNLEAYNFGFSGNGRGEPEVAQHLANIPDPACYVLDYEPNAFPEGIKATLEQFIDILREKHPQTPIFVMSSLRFNREISLTSSPDIQVGYLAESARFQQSVVRKRRKAGDKNIHFIHGGKIAGKDWHEFAVDGIHQTDLGFFVIAGKLEKILKKVL